MDSDHTIGTVGLILSIILFTVGNVSPQQAQSTAAEDNVFLLESYPSYSVVLPITAQNEGETSYVVKSPRFHRVMGVIQYLNLPLNKDFTCGSFIQFQDGIETKSDQICGNFDPDEKAFQPASLVGRRSYVSLRDTLKLSLVNLRTQSQSSYARIAFTAFRDDCYFPMQRNGSLEGTLRYRPCEYSMNEDGIGRQCIISSLFCDQIAQCAGLGDEGKDFAEDESQINCPHIYHMKEVLISSFVDTAPAGGNNSTSTPTDNDKIEKEKFPNLKDEGTFKKFFDEREEHLANLFKSAIIGFVGLCTICIVVAFVIAMFCLRNNENTPE